MRSVSSKNYNRNYYLKDCSGYKEFSRYFGERLEPRHKYISESIEIKKGDVVLDVGCGRGEMVFWAVSRGASKAIGIDYSKDAINIANEARRGKPEKLQQRCNFLVANAKKIPFGSNFFDKIFFFEVLEHLYPKELEETILEIKRVLKKDGLLLLHTEPNKWFLDITYRYWCYPISSLLIKVSNFLTQGNYPLLVKPSEIRNLSHRKLHVNEPTYLLIRNIVKRNLLKGKKTSTNISLLKPEIGWKDRIFNIVVYLKPLYRYFPFNILFGFDYFLVLQKK